MKKLLIATLASIGFFSVVSADIGVKLGFSAMMGEYSATGFEIEDTDETSAKAKEKSLIPMGSIFIEKSLGFLPGPLGRLSIGYDKVMHELHTGVRDTGRVSNTTLIIGTVVNQKVSAEFSNIDTVYATFNFTDWLYVRAGSMSMDVKTTESLGTGSTYGDTNLDGTVIGFGVEKSSDNGMFWRAEYSDTDIDGVKLISTKNATTSVTLDGIDGTAYKLSIGKAF